MVFVKNVSLLNPYLYPACAEGGFTTWLAIQGMVEASTYLGLDASLMAQKLDGRLA